MLAAGLKEEALRLVSGSDAWFRFKRSDPTHQAGLLTDIELCLAASPDLLQIARLCAAGQLVRYGAAAYADGDVLSLARLGRVAEALFQTRLRGDPVKAVSGFLTLLENGFREAEQETEIRIRTLSEIGARASALARFASALSPGDRERAQTAAREALAMMTPFNPEGDRYDTNATAGALEALVSTGLAGEALAFIDNVAEDWRAYLLRWVALRAIKSAPPALRSVVARLKRCPAGADKALTLAHIATALADINKLQAKRMLKAADEAARPIEDPAALVRTTARRAAALALLGGSHALRLFEKAEAQIDDPKVKNFDRSELLLYLTEALLAARNLDGAKRVAESIQSQLDRGRFAERVVVELIRQNRLDEAAESARPIETMESRAAAFSNLAAAFASAGRKREADEYLQLALDTRQTYDQQGHTLEALASMAVALYAVEPAITDRLLSQAIANVQSLPHDYDRSSSVLEVVRACSAAGRPVDAESLFSHIRNDVHRREAMEEVAFARGRLEQPEIAIAWAEERLEDDSLHWTTARIYRNSKRWVEAIDSVDRIARDYSRAANLAEIAAAMALAGETDAKDVFVRAESVARTATDDWSTPEYIQTLALGAVASALVSCGWTDEAWRVAESTERNRDGAIPRLEAAAALARAGDQRGSAFIADFWNMCLQNSHRDGMLMICSALAQAGLAKDTEAVAGKLLADPTLEARERTTVCGYLAKAGLRAPALRNLQPDSLDVYLEELARIAAGWPDCADILRETVAVASWVRSDWKCVHATIMAR